MDSTFGFRFDGATPGRVGRGLVNFSVNGLLYVVSCEATDKSASFRDGSGAGYGKDIGVVSCGNIHSGCSDVGTPCGASADSTVNFIECDRSRDGQLLSVGKTARHGSDFSSIDGTEGKVTL